MGGAAGAVQTLRYFPGGNRQEGGGGSWLQILLLNQCKAWTGPELLLTQHSPPQLYFTLECSACPSLPCQLLISAPTSPELLCRAPGRNCRAPARVVGRLCCPWVTINSLFLAEKGSRGGTAPGRLCGTEKGISEPFWGRKLLLAYGKRHHSSKSWPTLKQVKRRAGRF